MGEGSQGGGWPRGRALCIGAMGPWERARLPEPEEAEAGCGLAHAPLSWLPLNQSSGHRPPRKALGPWARTSRLRACGTRGEGGRSPTGAFRGRGDSKSHVHLDKATGLRGCWGTPTGLVTPRVLSHPWKCLEGNSHGLPAQVLAHIYLLNFSCLNLTPCW